MLEWPMNVCSALALTPAAIISDANVCRHSCSVIARRPCARHALTARALESDVGFSHPARWMVLLGLLSLAYGSFLAAGASVALADAWRRQAPLGWDTDDAKPVASAILFLASDASSALTGSILVVAAILFAWGDLATQTAGPALTTTESALAGLFHPGGARSNSVLYSLLPAKQADPQVLVNDYRQKTLAENAHSPPGIYVPASIAEGLHYAVLVANDNAIKNDREGLVRFLVGWLETQKMMGSKDPKTMEKVAEIAAKAKNVDKSVALNAIKAFQAKHYWVNNNGLNEKQMMSQVKELVKVGSMKAKPPTYAQLVDTSLYAEAEKRVAKMKK